MCEHNEDDFYCEEPDQQDPYADDIEYCWNCGAELLISDRQCGRCGAV